MAHTFKTHLSKVFLVEQFACSTPYISYVGAPTCNKYLCDLRPIGTYVQLVEETWNCGSILYFFAMRQLDPFYHPVLPLKDQGVGGICDILLLYKI